MINSAQQIISQLRSALREETGYTMPAVVIEPSNRLVRAWANAAITRVTDTYKIRLNNKIFRNNHNNDMFRRVVIHEFCHLVDFHLNGGMDGHGAQWSHWMRFFKQSPDTYVSLEESNALGYHPHPYWHSCGCMEHNVSSAIHNRLLNNRLYICKQCKTPITAAFTVR